MYPQKRRRSRPQEGIQSGKSNFTYRFCRNKRPERLIFRSIKEIPKKSVLCTPPFKNHPSKPSVLCTPPFEKSPIKPHRFCVLPPLKNHSSKPHRFCVLPPLKITVFDGRLFRQIRCVPFCLESKTRQYGSSVLNLCVCVCAQRMHMMMTAKKILKLDTLQGSTLGWREKGEKTLTTAKIASSLPPPPPGGRKAVAFLSCDKK